MSDNKINIICINKCILVDISFLLGYVENRIKQGEKGKELKN